MGKIGGNEVVFSAMFAAVPFFMYLGRAFFYIHFAIVVVWFLLFFEKKSLIKNRFSAFVIFTFIYFILTVLINIIPSEYDFANNISKQVAIALMVLAFCYIMEYLFLNSENLETNQSIAVKTVFFGLAALSFLILFGYILQINLLHSIKYFKIVKFSHSMYHSTQNFLAIGFPFLLYYFFRNRSFLSAFLLSVCILAHFASYGRTAILVVLISGAVYLYLSSSGRRNFPLYFLILCCAGIALISVTYISSGDPFAFSKIHTSKRVEGALLYVQYVSENGHYLGLGVDGADFLRQKGVIPYGSPHNIFLEAYVSLGLSGLAVFSLFVLFLSVQVKRIFFVNQDPHQRALVVSVLVAVLLDCQSYMSLWSKHNMVLIFFYLFLAICIATKSVSNKLSNNNPGSILISEK